MNLGNNEMSGSCSTNSRSEKLYRILFKNKEERRIKNVSKKGAEIIGSDKTDWPDTK